MLGTPGGGIGPQCARSAAAAEYHLVGVVSIVMLTSILDGNEIATTKQRAANFDVVSVAKVDEAGILKSIDVCHATPNIEKTIRSGWVGSSAARYFRADCDKA